MTRNEFRYRMLCLAEDYVLKGEEWRDSYYRAAWWPFGACLMSDAICVECHSYTLFAFVFFQVMAVANTGFMLNLIMESKRLGDEAFQRWLWFRQETMDNMNRILNNPEYFE